MHDRCEAYLFISGNAQYLVEGSVYPLERGSLLIMRPGEAHCVRFLGETLYGTSFGGKESVLSERNGRNIP